MNIHFNDSGISKNLWPLSCTRNVADMRIGILTIREKWELLLTIFYGKTAEVTVDASFIPSKKTELSLTADGQAIAQQDETVKQLTGLKDIIQLNDWAIRHDFEWLTKGVQSQPLPPGNNYIAPENIFIEEGASISCSTINASTGPVYIGKDATIMEGCLIRGPFALCEGAILKMGAKVYGATTIGPYCSAGGEIKNSILFGFSNKAHDGYLGDSVIGTWCNLGAGTTNSNVKNTAGEVKLWNNALNAYAPAGIKAGLIMGDYSRAAINTSFNTGTVVGVCCNVLEAGSPPKLIPHFTWGKERYIFDNALRDISNWKKLKGQQLKEAEIIILQQLYQST